MTPIAPPPPEHRLLASTGHEPARTVDPETGEVFESSGEQEAQEEDALSHGHLYQPSAQQDPGFLFVTLLEEAKRRGFPVKNCYLCRYEGENWGLDAETVIFCKILKRMCNSNAPVVPWC